MILTWIRSKFQSPFEFTPDEPKGERIHEYPDYKPYHTMNRTEKRKYKRWLAKHNQWDGDIVIENLEKNNKAKFYTHGTK